MEKLTPEEIETLTSLLRRVTPLPEIELPVLKTIWEQRLFPMIALELLIIERPPLSMEKCYPRILLTYRNDPDYPSCWHHPGGYLGSNEYINPDAIQKLAFREIKTRVKNIQEVGSANLPRSKRDHAVTKIFLCQPENALTVISGKLEYFDFDRLPENILPIHKRNISHARLYIDLLRRLNERDHVGKELFLLLHTPFESNLEK